MKNLDDALSAYLLAVGELRSAKKLRYRLNCWARFESPTLPVTAEAVQRFRQSAVKSGLAARTINDTIADVCCILKGTGQDVPETGRRLIEPAPRAEQPTVRELGLLYEAAPQAVYPQKMTEKDRTAFWRAFIVLQYHWPFRLSDLLRLKLRDIYDGDSEPYPRAELKGEKTGAIYAYPLTECCRRHLESMKHTTESILPVRSRKHLRAELARLCELAAIPKYTPQSIRRASLTSYACLGNDCGALAHHGASGLGVRAYYVSMIRVLSQAIDRFDVPDEMLVPRDRDRKAEQVKRLSAIARRLTAEQITQLSRMAEVM